MNKATRILSITALLFVALCLMALAGAAAASPPSQPAVDAATATSTPIDLQTCQIGGRKAEYSQTAQGLTILPYEQHDVTVNEWVTTWRVWGPAGREVTAEIATHRCEGAERTPTLDHCPADRATTTITHTVNVVIPVSGTIDFSVSAPVDCCEIDQNDLLFVNGLRWDTSFFVRWAESPLCPFPGSPTPSQTATATGTATVTATATPTPELHKDPWHDAIQPGYSQRYNITLHNTTGHLMSGVVITDVLPLGVTYIDSTIVVTGTVAPGMYSWYAPGGDWDGLRTVVWQVGDLPAGYYASMKVHVHVQSSVPPGTLLTNLVTLHSASGPDMTAQSSTLVVIATPVSTPNVTPTFTPVPECPAQPVIQVDSGSAAPYTDAAGHLWQPDQRYQAGHTWGYLGDAFTFPTGDQVWGTGDPVLYQTERWWEHSNGGYRFQVPNGDYQVLLKFAEIYPPTRVGSRVFTVMVEGVTALQHLDVFELAGLNTAFDLLVPAHVSDGLLAIDLIAEQGNPAIKAIAILSPQPCTATPTPTATATPTGTATATATMTATATQTATATPPETGTATPTDTATAVPSETATPTETATASPTATHTAIPADTATPTATPTETAQPTATVTPTATPYRIMLPIILSVFNH